jgi:hypothetical protein
MLLYGLFNFYWNVTALRRTLKYLGFKWKKFGSRRKTLVLKGSILGIGGVRTYNN